MKNKLNHLKFKFVISEILMLLVNTLVYKVLIFLTINRNISAILALIVSLIIDYLICIKYVFAQELNPNKSRMIKFSFLGILTFIMKRYIIYFLHQIITIPLFISKILGLIVIIVINYFTKNYSLNNLYKKTLKADVKKIYNIHNDWEKFISLKGINVIFKFLPHNIFLFIFFVGIVFTSLLFIRDNDDRVIYNQVVSDGTMDAIVNETYNIDFSHVDADNNINKICLVFGTYGRENDSNLEFKLNHKNKKVYSYKINTKDLHEAEGYCLDVPTIQKDKVKDYSLQLISTNADKNNSVTLYINTKTKEPTMYLKYTHNMFGAKHIIILIFIIIFLLINYYLNKKKDKLTETSFLLLMLVYLLGTLFIDPPLTVPDEPSHFRSSYNLAQNEFEADEKVLIDVPENIGCLNYAKIQHRNRVVNLNEAKSCLKEGKNIEVSTLFGTANKVTNTMLGHLPQAISIKIIDHFTNSPLIIFYVGRIGNFILAFLLLFLAIKIAPTYKNVILFIGLMPMFVQQMASLSYDALLNSLSLLFLAFMIKCFHSEDKIKFKDILIPFVFLITTFTVKPVYTPLAILLLFIPKNKFKDTKHKTIYLISILILFLFSNYLLQSILFVNQSGAALEPNKQIDYILHNPFQIISIAINTIKINSGFYLKSLVGYFGWFCLPLSDFSICSWLVCFILLIIGTKKINHFESKGKFNYKKIFLLLAILLSIGGIFGSMYFYWSSYKLDYVDGVQGRYFIPLLGFIVLLLAPKKEKINFSKHNLYLFCNILLFQYLLYLVTYYY